MEKFDRLLWELPGEVRLKDPAQVVALVEDCRGAEEGEMGEDEEEAEEGLDTRQVSAPTRLFVGLQLATGAADHLHIFSLSTRPYLGRTTLPPALSLLMANQARVVEGSIVLDPFCGTASTLLSCASRGAVTVGVEIDERVLHGGAGGRGIHDNFEAAGLEPPAKLLLGDIASLDEDHMLPPTRGARFEKFDAIVTDPPYGLMEGLGELFVPLHERLLTLLRLAARRLRLGGRLVFLLPLPAGADAADALPPGLPTSRCLAIEATSRQRVSLKMDRLMVTMVKVNEPTSEEEGLLPNDHGATRPTSAQRQGSQREADGSGGPADSTTRTAPWEEWWRDGGKNNKQRM